MRDYIPWHSHSRSGRLAGSPPHHHWLCQCCSSRMNTIRRACTHSCCSGRLGDSLPCCPLDPSYHQSATGSCHLALYACRWTVSNLPTKFCVLSSNAAGLTPSHSSQARALSEAAYFTSQRIQCHSLCLHAHVAQKI